MTNFVIQTEAQILWMWVNIALIQQQAIPLCDNPVALSPGSEA